MASGLAARGRLGACRQTERLRQSPHPARGRHLPYPDAPPLRCENRFHVVPRRRAPLLLGGHDRSAHCSCRDRALHPRRLLMSSSILSTPTCPWRRRARGGSTSSISDAVMLPSSSQPISCRSMQQAGRPFHVQRLRARGPCPMLFGHEVIRRIGSLSISFRRSVRRLLSALAPSFLVLLCVCALSRSS